MLTFQKMTVLGMVLPPFSIATQKSGHMRRSAGRTSANNKSWGPTPVSPPMTGPSQVDMATDANPPSAFSFNQWVSIRDELFQIGIASNSIGNIARGKLKRASMAMNLAQEFYGNASSVVAHQCGRLFVERIVFFLLGEGVKGHNDNLHTRIKRLQQGQGKYGPLPKHMIEDLFELKKYGNRVDHEELDDVRPNEKPDIVNRVYHVALFVGGLAKKECQFGVNCRHGPSTCPFLCRCSRKHAAAPPPAQNHIDNNGNHNTRKRKPFPQVKGSSSSKKKAANGKFAHSHQHHNY